MKKQLPFELVYQLSALIISIILVHLVYITVIRPNADAVLELRAAQTAAGELVENERSLYVVLRDYEQESCFILFFWAFAMMGLARQKLKKLNWKTKRNLKEMCKSALKFSNIIT